MNHTKATWESLCAEATHDAGADDSVRLEWPDGSKGLVERRSLRVIAVVYGKVNQDQQNMMRSKCTESLGGLNMMLAGCYEVLNRAGVPIPR